MSDRCCSEYTIADEEYSIVICDHILDSQYGQIGLTKVERELERLSIFKRLHNVSQLGLVNWIFPCALHTRYVHSLGVMHIAGQMASNMNSNVGYVFFDESDIQIIRLAAMLHDIGHYPMSHNVEQAYKSADKSRKYDNDLVVHHLDYFINCPRYLNPCIQDGNTTTEKDSKKKRCASFEEEFFKSFSGSKGFHHEKIGHDIIINNKNIKKHIKENFVLTKKQGSNEFFVNPKFVVGEKTAVSDDEINEIVNVLLEAIANMVIGNYSYENEDEYPWLSKYSAMIQLIHSELDADNLDYLLRDASFSGTSYGIMDMGQLMNCLTVSEMQAEGESGSILNNKYLVGIKPKGVGSVEQFIINKYLAYTQMTMSKYVSILEAMLLHFTKKWLNGNTDYNTIALSKKVQSENTSERYLSFTDSYIIHQIYELSKCPDLLSPLMKAILSRLHNYSAFDLTDENDREVVCTGFSEEDIKSVLCKSPIYQRFTKICENISTMNGMEFKTNNSEEKLFAFRFEQYNLTKQLPIKEFENSLDPESSASDRLAKMHYFRLANGIPVLDKHTYHYTNAKNGASYSELPLLIVDCPQTSLKHLCSMRFVALREYKIEEYKSP